MDMDDVRNRRIKRIECLTDRLRRQIKKRNTTLKGSWFKLIRSIDKNQSGDVSFEELQFVVYSELEISKIELPPRNLQLVWDVLDRNGKGSVTIRELASFMRRIETGKVRHVVVDAVEEQLAQRSGTEASSVSGSLAQSASEGTLLLRAYRTIGGYTSLDHHRSFRMGKPPENNDHIAAMVPRLKSDLVFRQEQKLKLLETLSTGGKRYPLMLRPRLADTPFAVDASDEPRSLEEGRARSVPFFTPLPVVPMNSHWSERLSCNPTHAALCRQHTTFLDLKHKYRPKEQSSRTP